MKKLTKVLDESMALDLTPIDRSVATVQLFRRAWLVSLGVILSE